MVRKVDGLASGMPLIIGSRFFFFVLSCPLSSDSSPQESVMAPYCPMGSPKSGWCPPSLTFFSQSLLLVICVWVFVHCILLQIYCQLAH